LDADDAVPTAPRAADSAARGAQASSSEEGRAAAVNDIPNFATGGTTIFIAELD